MIIFIIHFSLSYIHKTFFGSICYNLQLNFIVSKSKGPITLLPNRQVVKLSRIIKLEANIIVVYKLFILMMFIYSLYNYKYLVWILAREQDHQQKS